MKRTIKISIQDFETITDSSDRIILQDYNNKLSPIEDHLYLKYKDYLSDKKETIELFTFEVSKNIANIFSFIHIIDFTNEIKNLSALDRFLLTIYVVNTYGSLEDKETDELIINLAELEVEIDDILVKENLPLSTDPEIFDPTLDQILTISCRENLSNKNHIIDFKDIYLTFEDQIIPELSKEDAICKLREIKLDQLFNKS